MNDNTDINLIIDNIAYRLAWKKGDLHYDYVKYSLLEAYNIGYRDALETVQLDK